MASMMSASTTEDTTDHSLPSFTTFTSDLDPSWDYYERAERNTIISADVITSQANNYTRPWEMESKEKGFEPFPKLPSFQSQFHTYTEPSLVPEPSLPQAVPVPVSPSSVSSPGNGSLTQLTPINTIQSGLTPLTGPSFHTLTTVNARPYPLVPAPIQARDIPTIQQQYLDERHIQLYQPITAFAAPTQNVVTVIKNEPQPQQTFDIAKNGLHHSNFQTTLMDSNSFDSGKLIKDVDSPMRTDNRKKERRKIRASSMESSAESEGSAMDLGDMSSGQVAAVSSTANFKSPLESMGLGDSHEDNGEKQTKKKRKRCGECIGCQRKDNCGDCAPCRNDKSHQICKQRRCEKLTDKKLIYGADGTLIRGESRRGRGKGRGGSGTSRSSFRGRKSLKFGSVVSPRPQPTTSSISPQPATVPHPSPNTTTSTSSTNSLGINSATPNGGASAATVNQNGNSLANGNSQTGLQHPQQQQPGSNTSSNNNNPNSNSINNQAIQQQNQQQQIVQPGSAVMKDQPQQPMAPMAFYPTWQADTSQGWQNQFIQQIPQNTINTIEFQPPQGYTYQTNGYVQTGLGFDPNYGRTYAAPVQRYEFQATNQIQPGINQVSLQNVSFAPTVTYAGQVSAGPSPVILASTQQQQQHHNGQTMQTSNGMDALQKSVSMPGNEMPGYPRVNSVPPRSLNCNGFPGNISGTNSSLITTSATSNGSNSTQTSSHNQMNPPQVPQSPSRNQDHMTRFSPNHNNNNNNTYRPPSQTNTESDWDWSNQSHLHQQPGEMFNQSDRVNLNTRLKTMILGKDNSMKDTHHGYNTSTQQMTMEGDNQTGASSQTGHFLSYSHHLRESVDRQPLGQPGDLYGQSSDSLADLKRPRCPSSSSTNVEPSGGGGKSEWKESSAKTEDSFHCHESSGSFSLLADSIRKPSDPGGGGSNSSNTKSTITSQSSHHHQGKEREHDEDNNGRGFQNKEPRTDHKYPYNDNYYNMYYNTYGNNNSTAPSPATEGGFKHPSNFTYLHPNSEHSSAYPAGDATSKDIGKSGGSLTKDVKLYQPQHLTVTAAGAGGGGGAGTTTTDNNNNGRRNRDESENREIVERGGGEGESSQTAQTMATKTRIKKEPSPDNFNLSLVKREVEQPASDVGDFQPFIKTGYDEFNANSQRASFAGESNYNGYYENPNGHLYPGQYMATEKGQPPPQFQDNHQFEPNVICPTNFEKEIPAHTYHIPSRTHVDSEASRDSGQGTSIHGDPDKSNSSSQYNPDRLANLKATEAPKLEMSPVEEEIKPNDDKEGSPPVTPVTPTTPVTPVDRTEKANKPEVPDCDCFPSDKTPPEPGSYYTHLGSAASLSDLRNDFETRFNIRGRQLRIEKVIYTGKEGKTTQGCPMAKWIIRRTDHEEKVLCVVKRRQGHRCQASFIVICIVVWDGVPTHEADNVYKMLIQKLNKFGLPTTRRCATNENRTCACQGLDPETSGASYSFGCSWSMYYNGCKYARSKTVRKFRLSVKSEEAEIEERMNLLATMLSPLYLTATPKAFENQCKYENEAPDCRLGFHTGKPFSGVTACLDFCAHAHRDLHNMQDGCTVQVALLRPRHPAEEQDEQLHILPLYTMDTTDETGSTDGQKEKNNNGGVQCLEKFPCEVRIRSTPLQPCRRHGKKRPGKEGEDEPQSPVPPIVKTEPINVNSKSSKGSKGKSDPSNKNVTKGNPSLSPRALTPNTTTPPGGNHSTSAFSSPNIPNQQPLMNSNSNLMNMASMIDNFTESQLQSNQISSTVLDSPYSHYDYNTGSYVDSRNYFNAASHQWPDYNNNSHGGFLDPGVGPKSREDNPDSTTYTNLGMMNQSGKEPESFIKPKPLPDYSMGAQNPYPLYPNYDPHHHHHHHHPAYQQNYDYRYNYHHHPHPYSNQAFHHHPYAGMYPPQSYSGPPSWNGMYAPQGFPTPAAAYPNDPATVLPQTIIKPDVVVHKAEPIGEVQEINDNLESFQDPQMGGIGIALGHGSVLFECAKHEMHATTALKKPNRLHPNRMTLIFYQHRNLNRPKHGTDEWEEKMRLKKQNQDLENKVLKSIKQEPGLGDPKKLKDKEEVSKAICKTELMEPPPPVHPLPWSTPTNPYPMHNSYPLINPYLSDAGKLSLMDNDKSVTT